MLDGEVYVLVSALRHIAHRASVAGFAMGAMFSELALDSILEDAQGSKK